MALLRSVDGVRLSPMASLFSMEADAAGGRHAYNRDGSNDTLPSIRGLTPTSAPRFRAKRCLGHDVTMTLSGSQPGGRGRRRRVHWYEVESDTDDRSGDQPRYGRHQRELLLWGRRLYPPSLNGVARQRVLRPATTAHFKRNRVVVLSATYQNLLQFHGTKHRCHSEASRLVVPLNVVVLNIP